MILTFNVEFLEDKKISVEEFIARITDEKMTKYFIENMHTLHYKEQLEGTWMAIFIKWLELNIPKGQKWKQNLKV